MTKFLLDENIPFDLIKLFEDNGYYTEHIKKIGKSGITNGKIYRLAIEKDMWIITRDTDFSDLMKFESYNVHGIILIRTTDTTVINLKIVMTRVINKFSKQFNIKRLITIFNDRIEVYP